MLSGQPLFGDGPVYPSIFYIEMDETVGLSLLSCTIIYMVLSAFCITKAYVRD